MQDVKVSFEGREQAVYAETDIEPGGRLHARSHIKLATFATRFGGMSVQTFQRHMRSVRWSRPQAEELHTAFRLAWPAYAALCDRLEPWEPPVLSAAAKALNEALGDRSGNRHARRVRWAKARQAYRRARKGVR